MPEIRLPYGHSFLSGNLPPDRELEYITPSPIAAAADPAALTVRALDDPCGSTHLEDFRGAASVAIAINDKTRPAPHQHLLPPLLERLERLGLKPERIHLIIATGTHPPMLPEEFSRVLPPGILKRYPVSSHDAADDANLVYLGDTERGTPVWINRFFVEADLRIVVGNIEPHQFQGYSGGVKSAAIGLAGMKTINRNHAWMSHPRARLGEYTNNPARQDVEDIGQIIGIHFALNSALNEEKELYAVFAGDPRQIMRTGIPLVRGVCQVPVAAPFDLTMASPGGHPKDINLYQAQKALGHAALVTRPGGTIILAAACPEGSGSRSFEAWIEGIQSFDQVFARFEAEGFRVGPHKAFQIARDASRMRTLLISDMPPEQVRRYLITPALSLQAALDETLPDMPLSARIGVLPRANSTIPALVGEADGL